MSNGESKGLFSRVWNWIKRVACTIVCAWKEILIWIIAMILMAIFIYVVVGLIISFATEFIFTAPPCPAAWAVNVFLFILLVIFILLCALLVSVVIWWTFKQLIQKWLDCWQVCG